MDLLSSLVPRGAEEGWAAVAWTPSVTVHSEPWENHPNHGAPRPSAHGGLGTTRHVRMGGAIKSPREKGSAGS